MLKDGAMAWEVKDYLVKQDRCEEVTIEGKSYPGKAASKVCKPHIRMTCIPPCTPLLYSKTGVWIGIPVFRIVCSRTYIGGTRRNRLAQAVLMCAHDLCFEQK